MVAASRMGPRRLRLGPGGVGPVPHWRVGSCPGAGASQWRVGGVGEGVLIALGVAGLPAGQVGL
jgi:hypothetical protein